MDLRQLVDDQADFIIENQLRSGAIPWYLGGVTDPWDHLEGAIALSLSGRFDEASRAYLWSRNMQNPDGSWYSSYRDDRPQDFVKDTNFTAYIATGAWFHYLATRDPGFLREIWPTVEKALDFALSLQRPTGEIPWASNDRGAVWPGAILTQSCCVWHSIGNAARISEVVGSHRPDWESAAERLLTAIRERPDLFDTMGENERRYAMNWFYPVLTGVVSGSEARARIDKDWSDFIIDGWGCRVAADEDVTAVAETSELIISLALIGEYARARQLLDWTVRLRDDTKGFSRGVKLPEEEECPDNERCTWTSAALIMAIAALSRTSLQTAEQLGMGRSPGMGGIVADTEGPQAEMNDFVGYEVLIAFMEERALNSLPGDILEIGAFIGGGTAKLARFAQRCGKKVYAVDVFDPKRDRTQDTGGTRMCDIYEAFLAGRSQLAVYRETTRGLDNIVTIDKDSKQVEFPIEQQFVFGFIDGNHEPEYVRNDFYLVWRNLVPGGAVGFHDYDFDLPEVTKTIDALIDRHRGEISDIHRIEEKRIILLMKK